jgi:two-component system, OmpR family, alkaline phosphatase synthesis response regulator PhoP
VFFFARIPEGSVTVNREILLVEDEATLALLLRERLEKEGYSVTTCKDGEQGLAYAISGSFHLLLLDVRLPGRNGFEVCRELRRHCSNLPVLMLTARGDVRDRVKGLKLGADDYLTKPFEVAELLARIEALLRRAQNVPPQLISSVFCFGNVIVDVSKEEVLRDGSPVELTSKEFGLLRYFISNPSERLSRQVLLEKVWGYKRDLNTRTVDLHVAQLRQKLEANPREPRHILTAFGSGYKFVPFP